MKVALILCPAWERKIPHIAFALLSGSLRKEGCEVFIFDLNNDFYHNCDEKYKVKWMKEYDSFWTDPNFISKFISENEVLIKSSIEKILEIDAQVVGFSIYYPTELMSLEIATRIKEVNKDKIVVFGGPQCIKELKGGILIKKKIIDAIVIGEGEATFTELVKMIERNKKIDFCNGILFKANGDIIDCGNRAPIMNLDNLPFMDFSSFSLSSYEEPFSFPMLSSRGCTQNCVFCTVNSYWMKYRSMSGERIFEEIKWQLKNFKYVNRFYFYDPLLNGNIKQLIRYCELLIENTKRADIPPIKWCGQAIIRPEMTLEILRKMKEAGCYLLTFGIESGSQKVLDKMNKKFKIDDAERIIRQVHEAGIRVATNFMFGFPTETYFDFQATLGFLKRNSKYIDHIIPSEGFCTIDRNTYMYTHPEEFRVLPNLHPGYWDSADGKNTYLERLRRFEIFCELASNLNMSVGSGYHKVKVDKEKNLKEYFSYKNKKGEKYGNRN